MKILVTGGSGFIGSALIRYLIRETEAAVVNLDKLTYAAMPEALAEVEGDPRHAFEKLDVCDGPGLRSAFARHRPQAVVHLAAESHVDRSIDSPAEFIRTNLVGTYSLLEAALAYWSELEGAARRDFRLHHVSTDEVFGSLGPSGAFTEATPYRPNSPYSASKAGSDHLVRAWHHTFGLPVVISNCSNNYGPFQFPEKLIPLITINGLLGEPLPVYGKGANVRDWLYVEDHARALWAVLTRGRIGESYNVGGGSERRNLEVVDAICALLDELAPSPDGAPHRRLIRFVEDRPGHDLRYAMDDSKLRRELGWEPAESLESGLRKTVAWYLAQRAWWQRIRERRYDGARLGTKVARAAPRPAVARRAETLDVLVLGSGGQVGWALCQAAGRRGLRVRGLTRAELDITDARALRAVLAVQPCRLVVNAAAYTAVDRAEAEPELAFAVNAAAPGAIAAACAETGAALLQLSTDYVFDGTKAGAYGEDDPVGPLNVYGASKEAGERAVRAALPRHVILRTSWVFSAEGQNFVRTMLRAGAERAELRVVDDQRGCPTAAADLAGAILRVAAELETEPWGTYHFCGAGPTTWFDFAREIFRRRAEIAGLPAPRLNAVSSAEYPAAARRPANSVLDCARFTARFGIAPPPWRAALRAVLGELLRERGAA